MQPFQKSQETPENAKLTVYRPIIQHDPTTAISGPSRRIRSHQRSLDLFEDGFGNGWWYCIDHLLLGSGQRTKKFVIRREPLQAGGLPYSALVFPVIVVWPVLTGCDRAMTRPIWLMRWCPTLDAAFISGMRIKMIWGTGSEVVDSTSKGVPRL